MDAETLAHIFEPFFTTKEIDVEQVSVWQPCTESSKQHKALSMWTAHWGKARHSGSICHWNGPADQPDRPMIGALRGGTEGILIAEDNDDLREAAQEILVSLGYTVIAAKDGEEAGARVLNIT